MSFRGDLLINKFLKPESDNSITSDSDSETETTPITNFKPPNNIIKFAKMPNESTSTQARQPELKREYLDMIPEFSGKTEILPRFIDVCEKLVNKFYNKVDVNDFQNDYLMSSILAKIKGEAAINIASCNITNWSQLKTALIHSYADKRDCFTLNIELTELRQNSNESPFDFYNKVQKVLNLQVSYLTTHVPRETADVLIDYFKSYALRILLRGLREPLGSLMRTKNPTDLNSALNMLTNDFQLDINSYKTRPNLNLPKQPPKPVHFPPQPYNHNSPLLRQPLQRPNYSNFNQNNTSNNQNSNFNSFNSNKFNSYMRPGNSSQNTNVFKPGSRPNFAKPTPMSISTRNTLANRSNQPGPSFSKFSRPTQNFIAEELYNIDEQSSENLESENVPGNENENDYDYDQTPDEAEQNYFLETTASEPDSNS